MHILIVGGTRFIGPYVARQLLRLGHEVTVFHRGKTQAPSMPDVRHIRHESAGLPIVSFPPEVLELHVDVVVHMMAMGERDTRAAVEAFRGEAKRFVLISSGDVYRAYGRFTGREPGPLEPAPFREDAPLRSVMYPYRQADTPTDALEYYYEKILAEQVATSARELPATILRLPKVYGFEDNSNLATIYGARGYPRWRWSHGYAGNVGAAIALAATHPLAAGRTYNVGEPHTPTMEERLARLPATPADQKPVQALPPSPPYNYEQHFEYDTSRIREELGYVEPWDEVECMRRVASGERIE